MYVYIQTEFIGKDGATAPLYTAGHYDPAGKFIAESDHAKRDEAAARVAWLNGGEHPRKPWPAEVV